MEAIDGTTIFNVAAEAGVSITTVSHVFSGKRHVSAATRERVLAVAEELGYQPTASARALATRRTMTVALQHSVGGPEDMINPWMGTMLTAMSEAAMRASYSFLFVPRGPTSELFVGPLVDERRIDGAILVDPTPDDPFVVALMSRGLPVVSLGRLEGHPELLSLDNDHMALAKSVLAHFADVGYRRPALMSLRARLSHVLDSEQAFRECAGSAAPIVQLEEFSERCAHEAALRLLAGTPRPDAVYCVNDLFALGVLHAASELGIPVPDELGVVGVGDSPAASELSVPLSSVRVYPELAGVRLFEALVAVIERASGGEGPYLDTPEWLPGELVRRQSTARL